MNTLSFTNPGCQITHIIHRIKDMVPVSYNGNIILQFGGNDCSSVDSQTVLSRFQSLIHCVKSHAPHCTLTVSEIPPRFKNEFTNYKIREVNQTLHHMSLSSPNFVFLSSPSFSSIHFKRDGVHFNKSGFKLYVNNIYNQVFRIAGFKPFIT